ncbi:MAG: fluoride efflux transporter CrcB [Leptolyngbyaceae cyanobacterium bins.59]|nr:fluoride efflux transporter CrcB [Leptolyngbyaceae cyanobacterium bins.59]
MISEWSIPLVIAMGAIPGAIVRYALTEWMKAKFGDRFPYGTFVINLTGCFLAGLCFILLTRFPQYPKELDLLIRIGFLGSYTTFSTYGYDTLTLSRKNNRMAGVYWAGSAILGFLAVYLGIGVAMLWI